METPPESKPAITTRRRWLRTGDRSAELLGTALLAVLLLLAASVISVRGFGLVTEGFAPTAQGEERWFLWATGPHWLRPALTRSVDELASAAQEPDLRLVVVAPDAQVRESLVVALTRYLLPGAVVGVTASAEDTLGAPDVTVVRLDRESEGELIWPTPSSGDVVLFVLALLAAIRIGTWLLPAPPWPDRVFGSSLLSRCVLGWALGWALATCTGGAIAALGVPITRSLALVFWGAGIVASFLLRARPRASGHGGAPGSAEPPVAEPPLMGALDAWIVGLSLAATWLMAWKVSLAPLWSWDHFAIWGLKSRLVVAPGALDVLAETATSAPHYPLGVPGANALLLMGAALTPAAAKWLHLVMCLSVIVLAGIGARLFGADARLAWLSVLATALLPLTWNTETMGLAELPLAQALLAAAALLGSLAAARRSENSRRRLGFLLVLALGSLAFSKDEGLTLALGFVALCALLALVAGMIPASTAASRSPWPFTGIGLTILVALLGLVRWLTLRGGTSFADGDWQQRLGARLEEPWPLFGRFMAEVLRPETGAIWLVGVLALVWALIRLRFRAVLLLGWPLLQLCAYASIFFITYLDPIPHIDSSLARIASALEPVVVLGIAVCVSGGVPATNVQD